MIGYYIFLFSCLVLSIAIAAYGISLDRKIEKKVRSVAEYDVQSEADRIARDAWLRYESEK